MGTAARTSPLLAAAAVVLVVLVVVGALAAPAAAGPVVSYDADTGRLLVSSDKYGYSEVIGYIAVQDDEGPLQPCLSEVSDEECLRQRGFQLRWDVPVQEVGNCVNVTVTSPSAGAGTTVTGCHYHSGSRMYGGPEQYNQLWPIESNVYSRYPYVTKQQDNVGIAERYWLFSDGRYVHVAPNVPLFVDQNTNDSVDALCLVAENRAPYPVDRADLFFQQTTCVFEDARQAHEDAVERFLGKPEGVPDERMTTHPIWSTWARYKRDIDESTVRELAGEILANGFNNSQLEIDDLWETCYGSLTFDTAKFPDVRGLVDDLHALGFRVTLWVHPFINLDCEPYHSEALASGYLVTSTDGSPNSTWWNGDGSVVDFTNPEAAAWWTARLSALREETGIDSFKFDAGETSWLPQLPDIEPRDLNPGQFSVDYLEAVSQFGPAIEVRTGERTQRLPVYVRMIDKDSRWGFDNGLATLVTTLLQMNVAGYVLVLPDMVGGNGYGADVLTKELFIRWLQANVFMPSLQFSYVPWDFDNETVEVSRRMAELHARYAPRVLQLMAAAVENGSLVNPPIWWVDANDTTALAINSEYLLGEDLLVAPVLEEGAVSRDIYLPRGSWRDEADPQHPVIEGPVWLYNYSAPLDVLPYFSRVSDVTTTSGSSQLRLLLPATASSVVTTTVLLYLFSLTLQRIFT